MTVYEYRTSMIAASAQATGTTLKVPGGVLGQVLIRANTATTIFRANFQDADGTTRLNYDYHVGEINDVDVKLPLCGAWSVNITNASPNDTFNVVLAIAEYH